MIHQEDLKEVGNSFGGAAYSHDSNMGGTSSHALNMGGGPSSHDSNMGGTASSHDSGASFNSSSSLATPDLLLHSRQSDNQHPPPTYSHTIQSQELRPFKVRSYNKTYHVITLGFSKIFLKWKLLYSIPTLIRSDKFGSAAVALKWKS